jgi:D-alanine-D-alanine ligase
MAKSKIKIGLIFGGRSGEHEVSLISAWNIFHGLDRKKYDVVTIGIDKQGEWHIGRKEELWIHPESPEKVRLNIRTPKITVVRKKNNACLIDLTTGKNVARIDVFFPITHGTYGEDGCLQGMLEMMGAAYVGPGVLGSAVAMDKDVAKRLLKDAGFNVADSFILRKGEVFEKHLTRIIRELGLPIFVKPARQGSSVGISKAENKKDLTKAIMEAFQYDTKIILEKAIIGREIECAILGNENPIASIPGEIRISKGFYSYRAKYIDSDTALPVVCADLTVLMARKIQELAMEVFKTLECEGLSRVDFFLTKSGKIYVNEVNTLPGFTNISMYPKMMEQSRVKYSELLDRLIKLAQDRKKQQDKLKRDFSV